MALISNKDLGRRVNSPSVTTTVRTPEDRNKENGKLNGKNKLVLVVIDGSKLLYVAKSNNSTIPEKTFILPREDSAGLLIKNSIEYLPEEQYDFSSNEIR